MVEGGKAAGEAIGTTATGVAIGRTVASAGEAVLKEGKAIVRGASKAGKSVLKTAEKGMYRALDKIEQTVGVENARDFISAFNSGELPAVTSRGGFAGGLIAGQQDLRNTINELSNNRSSKKSPSNNKNKQ